MIETVNKKKAKKKITFSGSCISVQGVSYTDSNSSKKLVRLPFLFMGQDGQSKPKVALEV